MNGNQCVAHWVDDTVVVEGFSEIQVFYPSFDLQVKTKPVEWNELLQAECLIGQPGKFTDIVLEVI